MPHLRLEGRLLCSRGDLAWKEVKTLGISNRFVLLECPELLPQRGRVTIELQWPMELDDGTPLKLIYDGRIIFAFRTDDARPRLMVEAICHPEFKTAGRSTQTLAAQSKLRKIA
jgi:hypothetical protein